MARVGTAVPGYKPVDAYRQKTVHRAPGKARPAMQDLTMLLFTVIFFALAFLYVKACQKLR